MSMAELMKPRGYCDSTGKTIEAAKERRRKEKKKKKCCGFMRGKIKNLSYGHMSNDISATLQGCPGKWRQL